jgi:hypothetical protein
MSRISSASSSSGVRVAAQPLSNVYTVLLVVGGLSLLLSLAMLWVTLEKRYGVVWTAPEQGKATYDIAAKDQDKLRADLKAQEAELAGGLPETPKMATPPEATPAPVVAPVPAAGGAPAEGGAAPAPAAGGAAPVAPVDPVAPAAEGAPAAATK